MPGKVLSTFYYFFYYLCVELFPTFTTTFVVTYLIKYFFYSKKLLLQKKFYKVPENFQAFQPNHFLMLFQDCDDFFSPKMNDNKFSSEMNIYFLV